METLLANLADILECPASELTENTRFREHDHWDSLALLSLMAMLDDHYGVTVSQDALRTLHTVADLRRHVEACTA